LAFNDGVDSVLAGFVLDDGGMIKVLESGFDLVVNGCFLILVWKDLEGIALLGGLGVAEIDLKFALR